MSDYIAVVHRGAKDRFDVAFPDFPACVAAGNTIDEAKDMAHEALTAHMRSMLDAGESAPGPSKLEDIIEGPVYQDAVAVLVVSVPETKPRSVRVNITMPEDKLRRIDETAKKKGMSRSSFLAHAAEKFREVEYRHAIPALEKAHLESGDDTMVSMLLAEAYAFGRDPEEMKTNPDAYNRAMTLFDEILAREPANMLARLRRASLRSASISAEEALSEQKQLVAEAKGSQFEAVSELELARRHLTCGQPGQALSLYGRLQEKYAWLACVLHSEAGVCHVMVGDQSSAIRSFSQAVETTTADAMAVLQETSRELMGDAYWAYWRSVDNLPVRQCQNHAWLAGLFSLQNDMKTAREHLCKALEYLEADEVGEARAMLKKEFVLRMEQMFPKLAGEKEVQDLRTETESGQ